MLHLLSEWQLPILPDSLSIRFSVNFPFSYSQMQQLQFPQYTECRLSLAFWRISLEFSGFYSPVPPAVLSPVPVSLILFSLLLFSPNHLPIRRKNECLLLLFLLNIPIPAMIVNRCLLYVFVRVELRFPLYLPPTAVLGTAFAIFPICRLSLRYTCDRISFFSHL